jgi:hypothetical protein
VGTEFAPPKGPQKTPQKINLPANKTLPAIPQNPVNVKFRRNFLLKNLFFLIDLITLVLR